jgi:hypothetical protein
MLASCWTIPVMPLDVDASGDVSPLDVLSVGCYSCHPLWDDPCHEPLTVVQPLIEVKHCRRMLMPDKLRDPMTLSHKLASKPLLQTGQARLGAFPFA